MKIVIKIMKLNFNKQGFWFNRAFSVNSIVKQKELKTIVWGYV